MRRAALKFLALAGLLTLSGCGFQLRGQSPLPFNSAYVEAGSVSGRSIAVADSMFADGKTESSLAKSLRNYLALQNKLAASRDKADVVIRLTGERMGKSILSLSGTGKVREYRLINQVTVSVVSPGGEEMLAPSEIKLSRDFSYSDEQILAKEGEEAMLRKDMNDEALRQIVRRLAFVRAE
ncbi:MAG: hypothetical protein HGA75_01875 [Thiobacillus sp.]|nr:hypothetical protein [Thiobacillus sp.]